MQIRRVMWIPLMLILFSGCGRLDESRIVGVYKIESSCGTISLDLKADHSFVQKRELTGEEPKEITGKWNFETVNTKDKSLLGELMRHTGRFVSFAPFLDVDGSGKLQNASGASLKTEIIGPTIQMGPVLFSCKGSRDETYYVK